MDTGQCFNIDLIQSSFIIITRPITFDGCTADQVRVGEVQRGVQAEIGLYHSPHFVGHVVVEVSALQWDFSFLPQLKAIHICNQVRKQDSR